MNGAVRENIRKGAKIIQEIKLVVPYIFTKPNTTRTVIHLAKFTDSSVSKMGCNNPIFRNSFADGKRNISNSIVVSKSFATTKLYLNAGITLVCIILSTTWGVILHKL